MKTFKVYARRDGASEAEAELISIVRAGGPSHALEIAKRQHSRRRLRLAFGSNYTISTSFEAEAEKLKAWKLKI